MKIDVRTLPDPRRYGGEYWERSLDPFHMSAFPAPVPEGYLVMVGGEVQGGFRQEGWMAIDSDEAPVTFLSDGAQVEGEPHALEFRIGPYGRECAYPLGSLKIAEHEGVDWRGKWD